MIEIFQKPSKPGKQSIGFHWLHFRSENFIVEKIEFQNEEEHIRDMNIRKRDILMVNLEAFWEFCDISKIHNDFLYKEALKQVQDIVSSNINTLTGFNNAKKTILGDPSPLRVLVKNVSYEKRNLAVFMATTIINFLKKD